MVDRVDSKENKKDEMNKEWLNEKKKIIKKGNVFFSEGSTEKKKEEKGYLECVKD